MEAAEQKVLGLIRRANDRERALSVCLALLTEALRGNKERGDDMRTEEERAHIARQYAQASSQFEKLTAENRQKANALVRALYWKQQEEGRREHDA